MNCYLTSAATMLFSVVNANAQHFGDGDVDGDVDLTDFASFQLCFTGPGNLPDEGCWVHDFDLDRDVDLADFNGFQLAFGQEKHGFQRVMGRWTGTDDEDFVGVFSHTLQPIFVTPSPIAPCPL